MKTVNKTKIKVLPHDYEKKIDEIIASKKPVNEQLEDMLSMFAGVKFVDCTVKKTKSELEVTPDVTSSSK